MVLLHFFVSLVFLTFGQARNWNVLQEAWCISWNQPIELANHP